MCEIWVDLTKISALIILRVDQQLLEFKAATVTRISDSSCLNNGCCFLSYLCSPLDFAAKYSLKPFLSKLFPVEYFGEI